MQERRRTNTGRYPDRRSNPYEYPEDDNSGQVSVDLGGGVAFGIGGGLTIDSDGDLGIQIAPGVSIDLD